MNTITTNWNFEAPTEAQQQYDLQLLTVCGVSVLGRWCGQPGEYFAAWAYPLGTAPVQYLPYSNIPEVDIDTYDGSFSTQPIEQYVN